MRASAALEHGQYRLNGVKSFVTNAPVADVFLVYASTDRDAGFQGISAFVVEAGTAGLRVGERLATTGLSTAPIAPIYLDDCRIPEDHRIGAEGQGREIFTASMAWERSCLFATYLGVMETTLARVVAFARDRRQFNRPIGRHQAIAHRIADMKLRLEAARWLVYRACWLRDRGADAALDVALAKLAASEAAVQSGLDAIRIHGGLGVMTETRIDQWLRDALPATIFSGTSEIQRDLVARELGL